jgi:outer membrane immunogenic protein
MKSSLMALGATLSLAALLTSLPPARAAQLDDVLKRLEALEQENTSLRNRLHRLEGQRKAEPAAPQAKSTQAAAAAASPMAAYNAVTKAPPPIGAPAFSWTGFYIGAHVGGGWQSTTVDDPFSAFVFGFGFVPGAFTDGVPLRDIHGHGFLGGAQAGWNYQIGQLVVGVEANGSWSDVHGSRTDVLSATTSGAITIFPPFVFATSTQTVARTWNTETDWIATASTRVGFAWDRWLVYAKGGIAGANFKYGLTNITTNTSTVGAASTTTTTTTLANGADTRLGFLAGVGAEWAFGGNWSAFVEYNLMHFGSERITVVGSSTTTGLAGGTATFTDTLTTEQFLQTAKFGVNYRFPAPTL